MGRARLNHAPRAWYSREVQQQSDRGDGGTERSFSDRADLDEVFRTKAGAWRSFLQVLQERDLFDRVRAGVPREVQAFMDAPPIPVAWMPAICFHHSFVVLQDVITTDELVEIAHDSVVKGPMRPMKPVIEGILRIFGTSPTAFLKRVPDLLMTQMHGVQFSVLELRENEATIEAHYEHLHDVTDFGFDYWRGVLQITFELCRKPVRSQVERIDDARANRAIVRLRWD